MSYHSEALKIFEALTTVKDSLIGGTNFTLGNISIQIEGKDGIGGLIEEWFGHWAEQNGFNVRNPKKMEVAKNFLIITSGKSQKNMKHY